MYTIQEARAIDYLFKYLSQNPRSAIYNKNPKLVVELNSVLWYGDFVQLDNEFPYYKQINPYGNGVTTKYLSIESENSPAVFKETLTAYRELLNQYPRIIAQISDLDLLFSLFSKLVNDLNLTNEDIPLPPYLLNAKTLDGVLELPFFNLTGAKNINLVSLILID